MHSEVNNRLFAALSLESRRLLLARATAVSLPLKMVLYSPEEIPQHVYFLTSGMASIVASTAEGGTIEVGIVGREGMIGALHLLGPGVVSTTASVQMEGTGLRIRISDMQQVFRSSIEIRDRVLEFVQQQSITTYQVAGCNRLHEAEERLARWLLMAQDTTQSNVLGLTQEFLGMMVGARRTTVTLLAGVLQRAGLIQYHRGQVRILDRPNLEAAACDCYGITRDLIAKLYSRPVPGTVEAKS